VPIALYLEGVLAKQVRRRRMMDPGIDYLGSEVGLAEPHQILVSMDADVGDVGELVKQERLDTGDLHRTSVASCAGRTGVVLQLSQASAG
jgi:hypothetical protein